MDFADDFFLSLSPEDKSLIEDWKQKRGELIGVKVQKEIEAALEKDASFYRKSTPFVKILVTSVADSKCEGALLTIWNPTNQQFSLLKEGHTIACQNLVVKATRYDGLVQMTANEATPIHDIHFRPSNYMPRRFYNIFRVHLSSKKLRDGSALLTQEHYIDTAGIVIRASYTQPTHNKIYLTDESGLILRVETSVTDFSSMLLSAPEICLDRFEHRKCIAFYSLQLMPFDNTENCAVAVYTHSSLVKTQDCYRLKELKKISNAVLRCAVFSFNAGTTMQALFRGVEGPNLVALGCIIDYEKTVGDEKNLNILVDCGATYLQHWKLPSCLVEDLLKIIDDEEQLTTFQHTKPISQNLNKILCDWEWKKLYASQGALLRFVLQKQPSGHEVRQISVADRDAVSALCSASTDVKT